MTIDELVNAINASGLKAEQLSQLLIFGGQLVERETLGSQIVKARANQSAAHQAAELEIQELLAKKAALEAAMADAVIPPAEELTE